MAGGRPPIGERAMTKAERDKRSRQPRPTSTLRALRAEIDQLRALLGLAPRYAEPAKPSTVPQAAR